MAIQSVEAASTRHYRVSDPSHPRADHAHTDISPSGHVGVVYHYGTSRKSIVFRGYEWKGRAFIPSEPFVVAAPDSETFAQDSCQKPWLTALSDDSFVLCWHRKDITASATDLTPNTQVEACRIYRSQGVWKQSPIVVIDTDVVSGDADVMPRVTTVKERFTALAYVTQTKNNAVTGGTTREHDLRLVYHQWTDFLSPPKEVKKKQYLAIRIDDTNANPFASSSGGLVLPALAVDNQANLVLAYEEYIIDSGGTKTPAIQVKRLTGPYHSTPFTEMEALSFNPAANATTVNPVRRPMLASILPGRSVIDDTTILLATGVQDPADTDGGYSVLARITLDAGAMSATELTLPSNDAYDGTHATIQATAAMSPSVQIGADTAFGDASGESSRIRLLHIQDDDSVIEETFQPGAFFFPKRPALSIHRVPMGDLLVAMSYEGGLDSDPTSRFVGLSIFGL